jgi:hypothetical protein
VCCDGACNQQCVACGEPGHVGECVTVHGVPRGDRPGCRGEPPCGGICDGLRQDGCAFPSGGTQCAPGYCDGDVEKPPSTCDGAGECFTPSPRDCGGYACDEEAGVCKTFCATTADCRAGSVCQVLRRQCAPAAGTCRDAFTLARPDGTEIACSPYRCESGRCRDTCSDAADCRAGFACENDRCAPVAPEPPASDAGADAGTGAVPASSSGDGGCGCSLPRRGPHSFGLGVALLLLGAARHRRQARAS